MLGHRWNYKGAPDTDMVEQPAYMLSFAKPDRLRVGERAARWVHAESEGRAHMRVLPPAAHARNQRDAPAIAAARMELYAALNHDYGARFELEWRVKTAVEVSHQRRRIAGPYAR